MGTSCCWTTGGCSTGTGNGTATCRSTTVGGWTQGSGRSGWGEGALCGGWLFMCTFTCTGGGGGCGGAGEAGLGIDGGDDVGGCNGGGIGALSSGRPGAWCPDIFSTRGCSSGAAASPRGGDEVERSGRPGAWCPDIFFAGDAAAPYPVTGSGAGLLDRDLLGDSGEDRRSRRSSIVLPWCWAVDDDVA